MSHFNKSKLFLLSFITSVVIISCETKVPVEQPLVIKKEASSGVQRAKEIRESTAAQLVDGLKLTLWATDSLAPDPVAMSIDDFGAIYLTSTERQKNSEFDIRGHRDWMTASIALETSEERRAFLRKTFAPEKSAENEWVKDLNKDGIHDWQDLAVEQDEIWKLEDKNKDGIADISTRVFQAFNEEITDVAGALLVRSDDVFLGTGPDMWRLKDTNGDGVLENKKSISHGYAVHIGFSGHGMSGAIEGPDGKIYWGIGDIGANITTDEGAVHKYPNQGVIARSNPDGSNFEIFAAGLRNTHEFVFDDYGNIISADNDGDHAGESERLVYIVDGHEAGWRANWQYGKYTDPKNNGYNVWMDEVLFKPRWEGQAAYIIPPIMNFHNGPTGMTYNPGTALGSKWKNKFFLVEFRGNPSRSHIWSFDLKSSGASFELKSEEDIISGVLPTGMRFGPDGALYFSDWINGWGTKDYGRVWKLDVEASENDLKAERIETERLIQLAYKEQSDNELLTLLNYEDQRIRLKSQFELATRGKKGAIIFQKAIDQKENQLARVHAIWGIGQLAADRITHAKVLITLLDDSDPEIIAQAAKVIGDLAFKEAGSALIPLLSNNYPRAKFFGAQALGRIKHKDAIDPILAMLKANKDEDLYLRHAGVLALSRIGNAEPMIALAKNDNRSLRLAALLVLRRLQHPDVALFLEDKDEYLVTEAARAINDDWSIEASLPQLAAILKEDRFTSEPLLRRAINASLRVGGEAELDQLLTFANRESVSAVLRAEALATVGTWANPSVLDRVDGRYRGEIKRDIEPVKAKVLANMDKYMKVSEPSFLVAMASMLGNLNISDYNPQLEQLMISSEDPKVKSSILDALVALKHNDIEKIIKFGMEDDDRNVRTTALKYLSELNISKENLPGIVGPIFEKGTTKEQQQTIQVLSELPLDKTSEILEGLIDQMIEEKLSPALTLDLIETVKSTKSEKLITKLKPLESSGNTVAAFKETLYGGDEWRGRNYFMKNSMGQCTRCHNMGGSGGDVGPALSNIGNILTREQILEALIEPSARLSPGFGTVSLTLKDGQSVTGTLLEEREDELILQTSEAEPLEIAISRIAKRRNNPSSMPPMGTLMSKREIRDMVEFLANRKGD
ncbi:MAG: quinoprotein glucose dehydrogenase [Cyclobacteriaceae bacterium]|jgi:putative membrane-bound dehydrogenase-like protein